MCNKNRRYISLYPTQFVCVAATCSWIWNLYLYGKTVNGHKHLSNTFILFFQIYFLMDVFVNYFSNFSMTILIYRSCQIVQSACSTKMKPRCCLLPNSHFYSPNIMYKSEFESMHSFCSFFSNDNNETKNVHSAQSVSLQNDIRILRHNSHAPHLI